MRVVERVAEAIVGTVIYEGMDDHDMHVMASAGKSAEDLRRALETARRIAVPIVAMLKRAGDCFDERHW